jgi:hypothetical protein
VVDVMMVHCVDPTLEYLAMVDVADISEVRVTILH